MGEDRANHLTGIPENLKADIDFIVLMVWRKPGSAAQTKISTACLGLVHNTFVFDLYRFNLCKTGTLFLLSLRSGRETSKTIQRVQAVGGESLVALI
jgi:hypothetical protein